MLPNYSLPVTILSFLVGMAVLIYSSRSLVREIINLAHKLNISPFILSAVVIGIGTSLPELVVGIVSASTGDVNLAIGNVIGANIINISIVFGLGIITTKLVIANQNTVNHAKIVLLSALLFASCLLTRLPTHFLGGAFVLLGLISFSWDIRHIPHHHHHKISAHSSHRTMIHLLIFTLLTAVGGYVAVGSIENLSKLTSITTTMLGLTIVSLSTTIPEIVTTLIAAKSKDSALLIGNISGSFLFNLLIVGGLALIIGDGYHYLPLELGTMLLLGVIYLFIHLHWRGKPIPRIIGVGLMGLYLLLMRLLVN